MALAHDSSRDRFVAAVLALAGLAAVGVATGTTGAEFFNQMADMIGWGYETTFRAYGASESTAETAGQVADIVFRAVPDIALGL
jgi:ribose 5-phosphate isomerase